MSEVFNRQDPTSISEYYSSVKNYNVNAVAQALVALGDPVATAAYTAWLTARTAAAVNTPPTS
jgi:hypothetical protein